MKNVIISVLVFVIVLGFCACVAPAAEQAQQGEAQDEKTEPTTQQMQETAGETSEPTPEPTEEPIPDGIEHTSILLMGAMDRDFSDPGASYTLTHLLITLDPEERTIKFTSFPYNLGVEVETSEGTQLIQMQFANQSGEDETVRIIEQNFGIEIDHWVVMNMQGVIDIVDTLEGIEIDVKKLTLNEMAEYVVDMLGLVWEEVTETGVQTLSGVQTAGYFVDTMPETDDWIIEEEEYFREHHENIIGGVIASVKVLDLQSEDLIQIAQNVSDNYASSFYEDDWQAIADTAIYCLENAPQYLHVPQDIQSATLDNGQLALVYDKESDVAAIQAFVNE